MHRIKDDGIIQATAEPSRISDLAVLMKTVLKLKTWLVAQSSLKLHFSSSWQWTTSVFFASSDAVASARCMAAERWTPARCTQWNAWIKSASRWNRVKHWRWTSALCWVSCRLAKTARSSSAWLMLSTRRANSASSLTWWTAATYIIISHSMACLTRRTWSSMQRKSFSDLNTCIGGEIRAKRDKRLNCVTGPGVSHKETLRIEITSPRGSKHLLSQFPWESMFLFAENFNFSQNRVGIYNFANFTGPDPFLALHSPSDSFKYCSLGFWQFQFSIKHEFSKVCFWFSSDTSFAQIIANIFGHGLTHESTSEVMTMISNNSKRFSCWNIIECKIHSFHLLRFSFCFPRTPQSKWKYFQHRNRTKAVLTTGTTGTFYSSL